MHQRLRTSLLGLALTAALLAAGCAATGERLTTAEALDRILDRPARPEADRARDEYRHPKQTLMFFGVRPGMTVVEISPEGGWYTRILAPLLHDHGRYLAAFRPLQTGNEGSERAHREFQALLASDPAGLGKTEIVPFVPGQAQIAPPGSVDMVVTFRNVHNWMARDVAPAAFADMYRALKPGGVLGVVEHRGNPAVPQDPKAASGYVNQSYAIRLIEGVGFRLVGVSEVNANPRDSKDYPRGVWTLPPTYAEGEKDRARYQAIGESDRFTLKFVKPR